MDNADNNCWDDSDDERKKKEKFEDASNQLSSLDLLDLASAMSEVNVAINLFFNNQFVDAKQLMKEKSTSSMYHALGYSTLLVMEAIMTFESCDISIAMQSIKSSLQICNRCRRKQNIAANIGKMFGISNSSQNDLSEDELHAELIFAELNLYRAALTFIQDENLINFIKGALKIRLCYQTYNHCSKLSEKMEQTPKNLHFIGGVLLGCGAFNISLSLLPPRVLLLLEWIGFTSDKIKGMQQLNEGYTRSNLRSTIISLIILGYNLFVSVHLGTHDANLPHCEKILGEMMSKYPNGVYFHLLTGRLLQLQGDFETAIISLKKAAKLQTEWKQFSHLCYWELMWCNAFLFNWKEAAEYAEILRVESNWSKCVYTYLRATFLFMDDRKKFAAEIKKLMSEVNSLKQKFAGKSIPTEKFIARKARKYLEQGEYLVLPAHEMMYAWNGLLMLKGNSQLRKQHLDIFVAEQESLEARKASENATSNRKTACYYDDYCLLQLLKGACLRHNNELLQAELCYTDIRENYKGISKDHYLAPAALADLAWMWVEEGKHQEAGNLLKYVRKTYSHYSLESRIHFRMHAAQAVIDSNTTSSTSK
ncbi:unnamed protein product [Clavelina lepadiformis]|uniref:Tetratricopeptide repeat protein 39B n=1 Tax=Clavelina lepadiformis TaxID=159417 RepID=A0ABP0GAY6_CLALP